MLRRLLATLLPFLAGSCGQVPKPTADLGSINLEDALFSVPTLCDPAPDVDAPPAHGGSRLLHEDDWRQIEFVSKENYDHIIRELATLAAFKVGHQRGPGWTQVYVREEHPTPLDALNLRVAFPTTLSVAPVALGGYPVHHGFAVADAERWFIYGERTPEGAIIDLAVSPGESVPSEQFAREVVRIAQENRLLLVDWYAGSLVDTTSPQSVLSWSRRYQTR